LVLGVATMVLAGCALAQGVRPEDQAAWVGVPVAALDKHPMFMTMHMEKSVAADGTEIRNYVNGRTVAGCSGGSIAFSTNLVGHSASCMETQAACNNIFYIKSGVVTAYTPVGSGGMRCYTDDRTRPGFIGATNYQ
jgi:hypothetical protein